MEDDPNLDTPRPARRILSVSEVAHSIRTSVESLYHDVGIEGEISNFKRYGSGHCYFTLKDADAQIRCVLWKGNAQRVFFEPKDGMLVEAQGYISFYAVRGDLQLVVEGMRLGGVGALQKAFDQLKRRLLEEGLFDPGRKRTLPQIPEKIGIVTSRNGAVLHDMLDILGRRFPSVQVFFCPATVQGMGAAASIVAALDRFNADAHWPEGPVDVILLARGGGSMEDLWCFNEESVARAIFRSKVPVVSAVGHETDFSIADFVADLRAGTPSIAAELVVPDSRNLRRGIRQWADEMSAVVCRRIDASRRTCRITIDSRPFSLPALRVGRAVQDAAAMKERAELAVNNRLRQERLKFTSLGRTLDALNPLLPLKKGFALVEKNGAPVRGAGFLARGDRVRLAFADGRRSATILGDECEEDSSRSHEQVRDDSIIMKK